MSRHCEETYDVYHEVYPVARKSHTCCACTETIEPGQHYARISAVFDGEAETYKRCLRCQALHLHLRALDCDMWPDERLNCGEGYRQHWGEDPPDEVAALAFASQLQLDDLRRFAGRSWSRNLPSTKGGEGG